MLKPLTRQLQVKAAEPGTVDAGANDLRTRRNKQAKPFGEFLRKQLPESGIRGDTAGDDNRVAAVKGGGEARPVSSNSTASVFVPPPSMPISFIGYRSFYPLRSRRDFPPDVL